MEEKPIDLPNLLDSITVALKKEHFLEILRECDRTDLVTLRSKINSLMTRVFSADGELINTANPALNGDTVSLRRDILLTELKQILESQTITRARYYLRRLEKGIRETKTSQINDINLLRWKEYDDIITDSLWVMDKRDTSGAHLGWYWGNFIPQIPHQMLLRYTKKEDWVLDTFVGSGTTLIECRRLGRNGIGIELSPEVSEKARELVEKEQNRYGVTTEIVTGDSRTINVDEILNKHGIKQVQLLIMHPPYHDIIKFSDDSRDLSQAKTVEEFLEMFGKVVDNFTPYLEEGRYFALVIGDKYASGEWIPLGFRCMNEVLKRNYSLKSINVKNFDETRGKRNQQDLWRYRALAGGFYVFKHEYVMIFEKEGDRLR